MASNIPKGVLTPYPDDFTTRDIETNGAVIHVRVGGSGPAVLLLHGYGLTGDSWAPLAAALAGTHSVIVPDLRGFGLSSKPEGGYDKKTQAGDVAGVLDALGVKETALVSNDMGSLVAFAFAARHRDRVTRWVQMEAPIPGLGPWEQITGNPRTWHFGFGGPDMERLVAGRERIYLDHFWNEFSANPGDISETMRAHYSALYALPGAIRAGFAQFNAFPQDAADNKKLIDEGGKLDLPVLAMGGEAAAGSRAEAIMRFAANHVTGAVVPGSGHWLMEENPNETVRLVQQFLS
ncbi:MAG: alpha/beta hydrolase [Pseudomonadota bacterium]|nr:alpha/beta hydrolase [Pseudomonadota bacterium]